MQEQSCVFSANFGCNIMSEVPPCYRLEEAGAGLMVQPLHKLELLKHGSFN